MSELNVCFIIPCYNEEDRLSVASFSNYVKENKNVAFCFVNDGSSDNTEELLKRMNDSSENLFYINNTKNQGKAASVRNGVLSVIDEFEFIGYLDADLATPLKEIERFLHVIKNDSKINSIFGSRVLKLGSKIDRRFKRHLFGRLFATLVTILYGIKSYDSQCGAKIFRSKSAKIAFKDELVANWIFDVEVLIRLKVAGELERVYELPLNNWEDIAGSKIGLYDVVKIPIELLTLYRSYK